MMDRALEWIEDSIMSYVDEKKDKFDIGKFQKDFKKIRDTISMSYPGIIQYMMKEPLFGSEFLTFEFVHLLDTPSPSNADFEKFVSVFDNKPNSVIKHKQFSVDPSYVKHEVPPENGCVRIKHPESGMWVLAVLLGTDDDGCMFESRGIVNNFYVLFDDLEWVQSKAFNTPSPNKSHLVLDNVEEIKKIIQGYME